jgi:hypothetical protein
MGKKRLISLLSHSMVILCYALETAGFIALFGRLNNKALNGAVIAILAVASGFVLVKIFYNRIVAENHRVNQR